MKMEDGKWKMEGTEERSAGWLNECMGA